MYDGKVGEDRRSGSTPSAPASPQGVDARIGTTVGRCRILRRLGPGRSWVVYQGVDQTLERGVAIKFFSAAPLRTAAVRERFIHAIKATSQIDHSHIITIYDVGYDDRGCWVVMELLQERNVGHRLADGEQYPWPVATRMLADCCSAVQAAHQVGLLHGDIKPDNLMFSPADEVKLVDFGLTRLLAESSAEVGLAAWGSPLFLSPEQAAGRAGDARSDLYSLGATYYAMLTGQPPYGGSDPKQILRAHLSAPVPDPRTLVPEIAEPCVQVLRRAMEKEPTARYQDAAELAADLEAILAKAHGRSAMAEPSDRWASRRQVLMGATLAGLFVTGSDYVLRRTGRRTGRDSVKVDERPGRSAAVPQKRPPSIKIGILHSLSGPLAVSEHPISDATLLAIEELNARGGVLGRQLTPIIQDGKSEVTADSAFTRAAAYLLEREKVAVVFGGYGSSSRKSVLPYFEKYGKLLFYPAPYEGLEESPYVIYTGSTPNQFGIPAIHWCIDRLGAKGFFFVGTDGLRAHASYAILQDAIAKLGAEELGSHYALVGESQFAAVIQKIRAAQPQVILNMLVGDSAVSFFHALVEADITARTHPVLSFTLSENELSQLGSLSLNGHYVARTRFPELDAGSEGLFASHFQQKYGVHRPTSDVMEAAYYGVHLWAAAVEKAGSEEMNAVRLAITQQEYHLGGVRVSVDPSTQHTWKVLQIGKIRSDNTIEAIYTAEAPLPPIPFPPLHTRAEWNSFSRNLYDKWGGTWANPQQPRPTDGSPPHRGNGRPPKIPLRR